MSHFSMLVVTATSDEDELIRVLQPYHEYECTGTKDEYVVWVDKHDEVIEDWADLGDVKKAEYEYETIDDYAKDYHGYERKNDRFGNYTNPNAKWDWWMTGGRFGGKLLSKSTGQHMDRLVKSDLDIAGMTAKQHEAGETEYNDLHAIIAGRNFSTWRSLDIEPIEDRREFYHAQQVVKDIRASDKFGIFFDDLDGAAMSKEDYTLQYIGRRVGTFGILWMSWHQRGDMGWFGMISNEKDPLSWEKEWFAILDEVPGNRYLTIVDCHI